MVEETASGWLSKERTIFSRLARPRSPNHDGPDTGPAAGVLHRSRGCVPVPARQDHDEADGAGAHHREEAP